MKIVSLLAFIVGVVGAMNAHSPLEAVAYLFVGTALGLVLYANSH